MWRKLFDPAALFWRWMSTLADVLLLSLLWFFTSLPLLTLGAATTALYDASTRCVRTGENGAWLRYLRTFWRELPVAVPATLLWGGLLTALAWGLRLLWQAMLAKVAGAPLAAAVYAVALLIPVGAFLWMFPLLSRFTFSLGGLLRTSLQFSLAYLPFTVLIVVFTAAVGLVSLLFLLPMLVTPCLTTLFWSIWMERAFRKHLPTDPLPPSEE